MTATAPSTADARPVTAHGIAHLPVLDALRTLAVVPVVGFHAWHDQFPGGFIGVDLFFVISGFLITSILLREREAGRVDLRAFWGRRFRRLVPAVVVLIAVCAVVSHLLGEGSALGFVDAVGALTWSQNWLHLWASQTRWGLGADPGPVDHLWSLAVEEQFYVVWPLVLVAICRLVPRRPGRMAVVAALGAASAVAMGALGPVHGYFRSDARAFELLGGALLALSGWRPSRFISSVLGAIGIVAVIVFTFAGSTTDDWMFPWGFLAATAVFAGLVAAAASPPAWMGRVFAGPVQAVGRVSYGIYLWHLPVIRFLTAERTHVDGVALAAVRLAVLAAVVVASYRLVEMPVRRRTWTFTPLRVGVATAVLAGALVPLGLDARDDWRGQYDAPGDPPRVAAGLTKVLVVGDGVATTVATAFPLDSTWDVSQWQCGILPGDVRQDGEVIDLDDACGHWRERWGDAVERFRPDVVVVASSTWDLFQRADGSWGVTAADRRAYRAAADLLGRRGAEVVWFEPVYSEQMASVSEEEVARRMERSAAVTEVVASLRGARMAPVVPTHPVPGPGPVSDQDLLVAAARLAGELQG